MKRSRIIVGSAPRSWSGVVMPIAANHRYGRDRVRYASSGIERGWKLRAEFLSPRRTTRWDDLLKV
ncbi:DUF4113 domain-containing protein [Methylobacterium sp. J-059]|uniref:DUF4113 domain-containing protein n=1 Tax=Methylobacterium sp. J-059 TaxID=2836643 RepID=UPI001FB8AC46|nr:DUF4113 domain-containing protein [Methylobacterium sp. J-059]MCJ2042241.1 DUF4113 domain-containing protein [Methylobacterium sp. J-059]